MLKAVVDAGVPVLVFSAMVVVGMDLTADDFRRAARQTGTVVAATVGQFVLLPVIGWLLVRSLHLQPAIAQGVLLVATCPGGTMANVYTYLARANVALSVSLTAVSCLAAVVVTPLALAALQAQDGGSTGFSVPYGVLARQLVLLLLLPILSGMGVRRRWPEVTKRHSRSLLAFSVATLVALLGFIIVQEGEQIARALADIVVASLLLTVLAFGAGWATGWVGGAATADRFTVAMAFVVRNVGIATAVAVTALGRTEFAVFATAYFLTQVPLLVAAALAFRWVRAGDESSPTGVSRP